MISSISKKVKNTLYVAKIKRACRAKKMNYKNFIKTNPDANIKCKFSNEQYSIMVVGKGNHVEFWKRNGSKFDFINYYDTSCRTCFNNGIVRRAYNKDVDDLLVFLELEEYRQKM